MKIRHFLYNAFLVESDDVKIAIDPGMYMPVLRPNSIIPKSEWDGITHVLPTHGDPDHFAFAVTMAKQTSATVICEEQLADDFTRKHIEKIHKIAAGNRLELENLIIEGLNAQHGPLSVALLAGLIHVKAERIEAQQGGKQVFIGPFKVYETMKPMQVYSRGTITLFFGLFKLIKENIDFARGSIGFKITLGDKTIVNLGDTILLKDWEGLSPDVLMLPIGGREIPNTMNEQEALEAVRQIRPKHVIPCHYNCDYFWKKNLNPADDKMFKREVESMGINCHIMHYGDEIEI